MAAQPDFAVLEQAAEWYAVLGSVPVDPVQREAWQRWLVASPAHSLAWQRVERISGQFQQLPAEQRSRARSALLAAGPSRRQVLMRMLLLGGGAWLATSVPHVPWQGLVADQRSATGQLRELRLADGGRLWLNSRSAVDIVYDTQRRRLRLLQGELLLDTAPDTQQPARPLMVETMHGRLQAMGTRFSVRKDQQQTLLSVFVGAVQVTNQSGLSRMVAAGEQVHFNAAMIGNVSVVSLAREAWHSGVLLADNRTLADFIAELAEHVPGHLAVDPRVASLRLVGAFPLDNPQRIYAALEASLPVRVKQRFDWWVTVEPLEA